MTDLETSVFELDKLTKLTYDYSEEKSLDEMYWRYHQPLNSFVLIMEMAEKKEESVPPAMSGTEFVAETFVILHKIVTLASLLMVTETNSYLAEMMMENSFLEIKNC